LEIGARKSVAYSQNSPESPSKTQPTKNPKKVKWNTKYSRNKNQVNDDPVIV
jgi:ribosomal protein L24E